MTIRNDDESGRPLRLVGHSFRVLAVDGVFPAGRADLRLLSGDAFSVCNIQVISIVTLKLLPLKKCFLRESVCSVCVTFCYCSKNE